MEITLGQQYNVGEKPTVILYTDINRHARTILVTMYYYSGYMLDYDWWLCMVINISAKYNGGLLPDIILLTQGYYHWGTRLNTM